MKSARWWAYEQSATKLAPFGTIQGRARHCSGSHLLAASNKSNPEFTGKNKSTKNNSGWDFSVALLLLSLSFPSLAHTRISLQCLSCWFQVLTEALFSYFAFFLPLLSLFTLLAFFWIIFCAVVEIVPLDTDPPLPELCTLRRLSVELAFMHDRTLDHCLSSCLHHGFHTR